MRFEYIKKRISHRHKRSLDAQFRVRPHPGQGGSGLYLPFDVPSHIQWVAQDQDGKWWGYTVEPLRNDTGWYENEVGEHVLLGHTEAGDWEESLVKIR